MYEPTITKIHCQSNNSNKHNNRQQLALFSHLYRTDDFRLLKSSKWSQATRQEENHRECMNEPELEIFNKNI